MKLGIVSSIIGLTLFATKPGMGQTLTPKNNTDTSEMATSLNFNLVKKNWLPYLNYQMQSLPENRLVQRYQIGSRYKVSEKMRVRGEFSRAYGQRYDEDWIEDLNSTGNWNWVNTNSRGENFITASAEGDTAFELLPEVDVTGILSIRHNLYNQNTALKAGPVFKKNLFHHPKNYLNGKIGANWQFPANYSRSFVDREEIFAAVEFGTGFDSNLEFRLTSLQQIWTSTQPMENQGIFHKTKHNTVTFDFQVHIFRAL